MYHCDVLGNSDAFGLVSNESFTLVLGNIIMVAFASSAVRDSTGAPFVGTNGFHVHFAGISPETIRLLQEPEKVSAGEPSRADAGQFDGGSFPEDLNLRCLRVWFWCFHVCS